jgi:hypothetical protein
MQSPSPMPLVIGSAAIGRIGAIGPDAAVLHPGPWCRADVTIRRPRGSRQLGEVWRRSSSFAAKINRVEIVPIKGDVHANAEALGKNGIDAYLDFCAAAASTHMASCLMAQKNFGRGCFMGGIREDVAIP